MVRGQGREDRFLLLPRPAPPRLQSQPVLSQGAECQKLGGCCWFSGPPRLKSGCCWLGSAQRLWKLPGFFRCQQNLQFLVETEGSVSLWLLPWARPGLPVASLVWHSSPCMRNIKSAHTCHLFCHISLTSAGETSAFTDSSDCHCLVSSIHI